MVNDEMVDEMADVNTNKLSHPPSHLILPFFESCLISFILLYGDDLLEEEEY